MLLLFCKKSLLSGTICSYIIIKSFKGLLDQSASHSLCQFIAFVCSTNRLLRIRGAFHSPPLPACLSPYLQLIIQPWVGVFSVALICLMHPKVCHSLAATESCFYCFHCPHHKYHYHHHHQQRLPCPPAPS